ncbi:oxidoreductase [Amylibacter ulvae]|uniref:Oxidoreductase n=1 Tax=Paramylibacter ulvae TaxID=1651968 RepID=A0ABQ3D298_9RHOB|nr:SDR family NAD(P)-dependent oxidoreductase [Amylibacter ulvae]GHA53812.1 oxidoreductase [Amylibacter ulvae]
MTKFSGKIALVTGASRGLGAAIAEHMAAQGAHVIAVARTSGALEELDDRIQAAGGSATLAPFDITDEGALQRLCLSIYERWAGLDYWMHCAIHATPLAPVPHIGDKDWAKSIAVNITATGRLIANVEPLLQMKSGTAVHFDDPVVGKKFYGNYGAAKAAQGALFKSWALETANSGMSVRSLAPNPMPTATRARFHPGEDRDALTHPSIEAKRLLQSL